MRLATTLLMTTLSVAVPSLGYAEHADKTCGQMLADKAVLPEGMAKLMTAVVAMLDAHAKFMLAGKPGKEAKGEARALEKLAKQHKSLAAAFTKTAEHMKSLATLPNAPHDMAAMKADPAIQAAMKDVVASEKEMAALLQKDAMEMAPPAAKK